MSVLNLSSQITFLYFEELDEARKFFNDVLELEKVYDPMWACVWRTGQESFVGGVVAAQGSIEVVNRGGVLISLTVRNIDEAYEKLKAKGLENMSEIKKVKDIDLKSFFFTGPEGYKFEIQQFTSGDLSTLF